MARNAFFPADILLPNGGELQKWAVVACDQFSSDRGYWERVSAGVGDAPSTLRLIVPEAYLEDGDTAERAAAISAEMDRYLSDGTLSPVSSSFVYVERTLEGGVRRGLVGKLDLEQYDYSEGSTAAIRASEGTIVARLPARIEVRRGARLELPHIMALISDENGSVIEPLAGEKASMPALYDFELCENGGHISGWQVTGELAENVLRALDKLAAKSGVEVVMGDGNHSLAAAKGYWDEIKVGLTASERETHPARYALVELNNVYDPAVTFEAIHRAVFGIDAEKFTAALKSALSDPTGNYTVGWETALGNGEIKVSADTIGALIGAVQELIDSYISENGGTVDYIHGENEVRALGRGEGAAAVILPSMSKGDFFDTVERGGAFPRKSFSIGHANEKRYYLECREIRP